MTQRRVSERGLLMALIGVAACGGGDKARQSTEQPPPAPATQPAPATPPPAAQPAPAPLVVAKPDPDGVVRITATDQMRFSANRIEIPPGQKLIKIELKNIGLLPKEAMGHDLVVLKAGMEPMAFGAKAMVAKATDYIPQDALDQILAHTKLLGPGESELLEFPAPAPGSYPFLCTFPGHVALMSGVLVVP